MATRAPLTPLSLAVLELLHERPMHPYEMHQTMRERHTDRLVKLKAGSLYHTVERLERHSLVTVKETLRTGRRPERTVYALTDAGRDAFAEQAAGRLGTPAEEFPDYPLALSMSQALDRQTVLVELTRRQGELHKRVAAFRDATERLRERGLAARLWLDVNYELAIREAELAWTDALITDIEHGTVEWPTETDPEPDDPDTEETTG